MTTSPQNVESALATLRERLGGAAPRWGGEVVGALAVAPRRMPALDPDDLADVSGLPELPGLPATPNDRAIPTGFRALDSILGLGGLPRAATTALHGDGTSGKTTLALQAAAQAQAAGGIVAYLDLARSLDPVEAVARGVQLDWLVVLTPESLEQALAMAAMLLQDRTVDFLLLDLQSRPLDGSGVSAATLAERFGRLAALARRAGVQLLVLEPPSLPSALAGALTQVAALRLELSRRAWIRLGRDVVGQLTEARVTRDRFGPPGRATELRIIYAEGGLRDRCLTRADLLQVSGSESMDRFEIAGGSGFPTGGSAPDARPGPSKERIADPEPHRRGRATRGLQTERPSIDDSAFAASSISPPSRFPIMRLLHLYWPHLLLRLARDRTSEPFGAAPIVLGGKPWTNGPVLDASRSALELGVRPGMPLGAAHRLAPEALFLDPDPAADAAAMKAALDRLAGFSPGVAAEGIAARLGFGRVEVQLDGLERLWGPEPLMIRRIGEALAGILPGPPLAGIGGTRFAAAVASTRASSAGSGGGSGGVALHVVEPGADAAFLAPLPAALLSRDPEVRARLGRFGLRVIGQVAELPRSAVVARFGPEGQRLHARARGEETDPFRPRQAPERLAMALPIDPPVADVEGLRFVLHRLAAAFGDQLEARGAATARARLTLGLDRSFVAVTGPPSLTVEQPLPEPTSEGLAIERLLIARLEAAPPGAPVARVELELLDVAPAAGTQLSLFTPQTGRTGRLGWQLARLGLRFGEDRVGWAELGDTEAALPETRWTWRRAASSAGRRGAAP